LICQSVISGYVSISLANTKPGNHTDARWLNQFSRVLRIYVSDLNPTYGLTRMCSYIVRVYGVCWLSAKWLGSKISDGPTNYLRLAKLQRRECNTAELAIVEKTLVTSFFWAHEENVLLALLCSHISDDRELAIQRILEIRSRYCLIYSHISQRRYHINLAFVILV